MISQPSYHLINEDISSPLLLLCEHGGKALPTSYGTLGVTPEVIKTERNLLYDCGTANVTRMVAQKTGSSAVIGHYSRLLVDLNRLENSPELMPLKAHGYIIEGNQDLSLEERTLRLETYYEPYHQKIEDLLAGRLSQGISPHLFSIHSYTPHVALAQAEDNSKPAPDIGLLYTQESPLLDILRDVFESASGISMEENYPYDLRKVSPGSLFKHGTKNNIPSVAVEISIDRLKTAEDELFWAELLTKACLLLNDQPEQRQAV